MCKVDRRLKLTDVYRNPSGGVSPNCESHGSHGGRGEGREGSQVMSLSLSSECGTYTTVKDRFPGGTGHTPFVEAMGAMALLPICNSSFTCEDYSTYRAHPWSSFFLRRAHPRPGPRTRTGRTQRARNLLSLSRTQRALIAASVLAKY